MDDIETVFNITALLYSREASGCGMLSSVLARGDPHLLLEGAVEGSDGAKAHKLADLGDGQRICREMATRRRNAKEIDVIVEAHFQLVAEKVRNIIFAHMKLITQDLKRKLSAKVFGAKFNDGADGARVASVLLLKGHRAEKLGD